MSRVLIIPDLHIPYHHIDALPFLKKVSQSLQPDKIISIGDMLDHHALSYHEKDPNLHSAIDEHSIAFKDIQRLYKLFPNMTVVESNHGDLPRRKARSVGLPSIYIRGENEVLCTPNWEWVPMYEYEGVRYQHQGCSNTLNGGKNCGMNYVQGHHHSKFELLYWNTGPLQQWAMTVGCLVDGGSLAFAYAKHSLKRPVLGCGFVLDGVPLLVPMILDKEGRWVGSV